MLHEAIINGANTGRSFPTFSTPIAVIQVEIYQMNHFALVVVFTGSSEYLAD
jgi:hypothetical protein